MPKISQHSNTPLKKSTQDIRALMDDILYRAKKKGATAASVAIQHDSGFSVDVRLGEVETIAFSEDHGVGITVYIGQRKGSASSTDTEPKALEAMVAAAIDIAQVSAADPCFGLANASLMASDYPDLDLYHPWDIKPLDAIDLAIKCERQALALDKRVRTSDGVQVASYTGCQSYANTHGFSGLIESSHHSMSCSLIAEDGNKMQRDYEYTVARDARHLMPLDVLAANAVQRTVSRLGAKPIKTQTVPILFSSRVSSGLFGAFINAISGSNLYRKNSFLLDSVGMQLFPETIQIYDAPHLLGALGSAPFDGEGVLTRPNIWVKDGKICQYVLNSYSARKLGLETTANNGGVFNLTIDATAGGFDDMLHTMGRGLLVTELMGQGVNGLTGDYSRGASGFWVEDGRIQFPVEEVTIAGNLKEMFAQILAVGSDRNPNIATRCGSVLIEKMVVAGR